LNLMDLIKSVRHMTDEELKTAIVDVRRSRMTPKATSVKAKKKTKAIAKKATKKSESIKDLLSQLTPDQIQGLLKGLE